MLAVFILTSFNNSALENMRSSRHYSCSTKKSKSQLEKHLFLRINGESIFVCVVNARVIIVYYCSFMYSRINKLKKWSLHLHLQIYIYLLTTITKALYQPSEKDMSLLFTCPQLTEESSLAAAARTWLHTAHIM